MERLKLIRSEEGYSVYENPDKELVEQIKAFPQPMDFTHYMITGRARLLEFNANGKAVLTNDDGDLATIDADKYYECLRKEHMRQLNLKYKVSDTVNKYFTPVPLRNMSLVKMTSDFCMHRMFGGNLVEREVSFYDGVEGIFVTDQFLFYIDHEGNIHLNLAEGGYRQMGHMYFTKDGEIKNRDYNLNLNWDGEITTRAGECEKFLAYFSEFKEFEYASNTWFTPEYCFKVFNGEENILVERLNFNGKIYTTGGRHATKARKPKKNLITVDGEHLINRLKEVIEKRNKDANKKNED